MKPRFGRYSTILVAASIMFAGCAAPSATTQLTTPSSIDTLYSDLDNPTTIADLPQSTSVLDVERYRPTYKLTSCQSEPITRAEPSLPMAEAILAAQAYSDKHDGLGFIVLRGGMLLHGSFAEGVRSNTPSASASMMKSVIALLYGIAIDDGVIASIDDRVGDYIEEWNDDKRGDITLRQLMTMSAGLGQSDFTKILFAPDIATEALQLERVAAPDLEFAYNNAITKVLTMVLDRELAKADKGGVLSFLQSELWCPLGNGEAQVWVDQSGKARGYAGLHASLPDYARIGELIRNGGEVGGTQIVPTEWIAEMSEPSKANPQYGFHVWLGRKHTPKRAYSAGNPIKIPHSEPFEDEDIIYFDGFGGQRVYIIPSAELVVARFGEVNLQYDDSVIPNLLTRAAE